MTERRVIEGTWEEVAAQAAGLAGSGRRVRLVIPPMRLKRRRLQEMRRLSRSLMSGWKKTGRHRRRSEKRRIKSGRSSKQALRLTRFDLKTTRF
jgi:hypothetical protein